MNATLFFQCLFLGIACAVIAVTMICIMNNEPILNWWFRFGSYVGMKIVRDEHRHPQAWAEKERWFYKPIWGCEKCFAGQLCLWIYFIGHIKLQRGQIWHISTCAVGMEGYSVFCHLFAVCIAISTAVIFSHYINQKQ